VTFRGEFLLLFLQKFIIERVVISFA